jgi:type I restriction enzyme, S subunit
MSFPRYLAYKPSGVEWLGEVPEHWDVKRIASLYSEVVEAGHEDLPVLSVSIHHGVSDSELSEEEMDRKVVRSDDRSKYKRVAPGDLVYNMMRAWQGAFGSVVVEGMVSPAYVVARPKTILPTEWIEYLLRTDLAVNEIKRFSRGITDFRLRLYWDEFKNLRICEPPEQERACILRFLDRETAKIDALIAEQQRLIELLQEKRQAVISHAVTKGLNPNAPMKDSGVEWLGEVPEHWDVVQIKWLSPVKRGASPRPIEDPKYFDDCGEYAWVRISDVTSSNGRLEATSQRLSELGSSLSVKLKPGSLFVSIAGSVGKTCITRIKACIHDGFVYFPDLRVSPEFLELIFISGECFGGLGKLGTQLNLNTDTIGAIRIGVPRDNKEVDAIVEYCMQESERLGELEAAALGAVSLLSERRSALISAAVTGQIDARGLVEAEAGEQ